MTSDLRDRLQSALGANYQLERELGGGAPVSVDLAVSGDGRPCRRLSGPDAASPGA